MSDEEEELDKRVVIDVTGIDPQEFEGYLTNQIIIRRVITPDGRDRIYVDWPEDSGMLELLGMLALARNVICNYSLQQGDDDGEEEDEG
jgi:hypothetical protein